MIKKEAIKDKTMLIRATQKELKDIKKNTETSGCKSVSRFIVEQALSWENEPEKRKIRAKEFYYDFCKLEIENKKLLKENKMLKNKLAKQLI